MVECLICCCSCCFEYFKNDTGCLPDCIKSNCVQKLAFFWIFEIFVSIILSITLYRGWIAAIVCIISFLPPFIAFIKMKHAKNAKDLHMLYKTYVLFVIIIGVPLAVGGLLFSLYRYPEISYHNCMKQH